MRKDTGVLLASAALWSGLLLAAAMHLSSCTSRQSRNDPERPRELAAALEARGLYGPALDELDHLRETAVMSREQEADLLDKMGRMADEKLGDCERALAYYTMAAALNPQASWSSDAGRQSVVCLEKLGRKEQAQALLRQLTGAAPPSPASAAPGPAVAVVDGRTITWAEVRGHLRARVKPADLNNPEKRARLVQRYVFIVMLADEAVKKGYDQDPAVRDAVEQARREALAAAYLRRQKLDPKNPEAMQKLSEQLTGIHEARIFESK